MVLYSDKVRHLSYIPAFGFETESCNADEARKDKPLGCADGWVKSAERVDTITRAGWNIIKGFGYIPVIGMVVGLYTLIKVCQSSPGPTNKANHIFRAVVVMLNLGLLFLIPDIILTIHRGCSSYSHLHEPRAE